MTQQNPRPPKHLFEPTRADQLTRYLAIKRRILAHEIVPREDFLFVKAHDNVGRSRIIRHKRMGYLFGNCSPNDTVLHNQHLVTAIVKSR